MLCTPKMLEIPNLPHFTAAAVLFDGINYGVLYLVSCTSFFFNKKIKIKLFLIFHFVVIKTQYQDIDETSLKDETKL